MCLVKFLGFVVWNKLECFPWSTIVLEACVKYNLMAKFWAKPSNITLDRECLLGTNTLAYFGVKLTSKTESLKHFFVSSCEDLLAKILEMQPSLV